MKHNASSYNINMGETNDDMNHFQTESRPSMEILPTSPEIFANPPLRGTSLVYSVPAMGEWRNGFLRRMLHAYFSQHIDDSHPIEIEVLANVGAHFSNLQNPNGNSSRKQTKEEKPRTPHQQQEKEIEITGLMQESAEAVSFMKKIIEAQRIARLLSENDDDSLKSQLIDISNSTTDQTEKEILRLAMGKSNQIALLLIDATHTDFSQTPYFPINMSCLRTLGADIAYSRFRNSDVIFSMYDADTVPDDNHYSQRIQEIFQRAGENLHYLFTGMSSLPAGHSVSLMASGPSDAIRKSLIYHVTPYHSTYQINFKLKNYDKLCEIAGLTMSGFTGWEDFDTVLKLVCQFGPLQEGLLFESVRDIFPPTSLTSDRLDGSFDSKTRRKDFDANQTPRLMGELQTVRSMQQKIMELINAQPSERQVTMTEYLEKARCYYIERQKIQQRMNRVVLNTFICAVEEGNIKLGDGGLIISENCYSQGIGAQTMRHFISNNYELVMDLLSFPENLEVLKYLSGKRDNLPSQIDSLSDVQEAVREYVGEIPSIELVSKVLTQVRESTTEDGIRIKTTIDMRGLESKQSIMHAVIAEILALGQTYNVFFELEDCAMRFGSFPNTGFQHIHSESPQFPQIFSDLEERIEWLTENVIYS